MAQKRMFDKTITNSDDFIEMPDSSQNLYFHLSMNADDDGFVNNWKSIMRMTGHKEDDLKVLISKNYIIPFESGVIVIRHWRINNYLRNDRYIETKFTNEKQQLYMDDNLVYQLDTNGIHRIDKNSIDKNSIEEKEIYKEKEKMLHCNNDVTKCNSIQEIDIEKEKDIEIDNKEDNIEEICKYLESNYGRTISPLEYEKIKDWLETFDKEMVKEAIKRSVLNNKKTFSYINGILKNWKTNNVKTLDETTIEKKQDDLPQWFNKDIEEKNISPEEEQELKDILANF